jgi:hypothetical protein
VGWSGICQIERVLQEFRNEIRNSRMCELRNIDEYGEDMVKKEDIAGQS